MITPNVTHLCWTSTILFTIIICQQICKPRNYSNPNPDREGLPIFQTTGRNLEKIVSETLDEDTKTKAHRYVLFNCNVVDSFIEDHRNIIAQQNPRQRVMTLDRIHSETFPSWFAQKVRLFSILNFLY
ncbi:hypothetical protein CsatB_006242 [Cannabis sativa]